MHYRLAISQRLCGLTDNAWVYGIGLGMVSAPVIWSLDVLGSDGGPRLPWLIVALGTLGMTIGGRAMYSVDPWTGRPFERVLLLTITIPFIALFIASLPFIAFAVIGIFLAMLFGLMMMPMAIIVTACWTALYLSLPARERVSLLAVGAHAGERSPGIVVAGSLVLLASLATMFWLAVGSRLSVN
ncbi:MAG: hypothetical protein AB7O88_04800 [Reyranellaceae bacterium]